MLFSKLHCQKGLNLIPFSYKIIRRRGRVHSRLGPAAARLARLHPLHRSISLSHTHSLSHSLPLTLSRPSTGNLKVRDVAWHERTTSLLVPPNPENLKPRSLKPRTPKTRDSEKTPSPPGTSKCGTSPGMSALQSFLRKGVSLGYVGRN